MFKVTARDQGHYKGLSGGHLLHTVTFLVLYLSKLTLQNETLWIHLMFSYPADIKLILFNLG